MFGLSEEVEECVDAASKSLLHKIKESAHTPQEKLLQTLAKSCLHSRSQHNSVDYVKELLRKLSCVETPADVFQQFVSLDYRRVPSPIGFSYTIDKDGDLQLFINTSPASLPLPFYTDREKMKEYRKLLAELGSLLEMPGMEKVVGLEKRIVGMIESTWSPIKVKTTGAGLQRKFPKIPWQILFETYGIPNWKSKTLYYSNPRFLRFISRLLREVPIHYWRLYIARSLVVSIIEMLPPPFDELHFDFFRKSEQGQKVKQPQEDLLVKLVYSHCTDVFSQLFWNYAGSKAVEAKGLPFVKRLQAAAIRRLETTEWLERSTKNAAIRKMEHLNIGVVRPHKYPPFTPVELDEKDLIKNIFLLGEQMSKELMRRIGHPYMFWEEGVYRVNAFYFSENNEIMIPYGTMISPYFMDKEGKEAWNFGGLGVIVGHEMCHAFDDDGKDYDERGQRKKWWTRGDSMGYGRKAKEFIAMYNRVKVLDSHVNGKKTLSENIADNGGLAIALQALKDFYGGVVTKEHMREFFISYALSWRTKIRDDKLRYSLENDRHSPAEVRVNYVVNQFDEWYDAFDIGEEDALFVPKEKRIRLF